MKSIGKREKKTFFNLIKKARMCIVYYVLEKEIVSVSKFQEERHETICKRV